MNILLWILAGVLIVLMGIFAGGAAVSAAEAIHALFYGDED